MEDVQPKRKTSNRLVGRCFVHPVFDYLAIGGGLSLITTVLVLLISSKENRAPGSYEMLPWFFLLSNSTHFAASTVRLYTKQGTRRALPFISMAMPLVAIGVLTLCIFRADIVGEYIQMLYLMWSPYHYAAQAYGLGVMYSYRSGCILSATDKKLFFWIAVLPFFYANLDGVARHLLPRIVPDMLMIAGEPQFEAAVQWTSYTLGALTLMLPFILYAKVWRSKNGPMPFISLLVVATNGIWWVLFRFYDAFVWATIFHGVQYLAIVTIFHVKDQCSRSGNTHRPTYHVAKFYLLSLLLGYGLFNCWPQAYILAGFGAAESVLLVVAAINIHHFIVDAYIWRLQKGDSNRRIVDLTTATPAIATGA